jgi:phenylalanine-4-hydroxylase
MVHDVLGHLAMLLLPSHRDFLQHMSLVMARASSNQLDTDFYESSVEMANLKWDPASAASDVARAEQRVADVHKALQSNASELTHLRRMYIWSVEFGLMGTLEKPLLFGAAFFSSFAEFEAVCRRTTPFFEYSAEVVHCENAFSEPLDRYFVARDFEDLESVLRQYEARLSVQVPRTSEIRGIFPNVRQRQGSNA